MSSKRKTPREAALDAFVEGNLMVMCDVRSIALREGGRQHQNLLRGVARELAPVEGVDEARELPPLLGRVKVAWDRWRQMRGLLQGRRTCAPVGQLATPRRSAGGSASPRLAWSKTLGRCLCLITLRVDKLMKAFDELFKDKIVATKIACTTARQTMGWPARA